MSILKGGDIPSIIIHDCMYDITEPFIKGAMAYENRIPWKDNPYNDFTEEEENSDWNYGHELQSSLGEEGVPNVLLEIFTHEYSKDHTLVLGYAKRIEAVLKEQGYIQEPEAIAAASPSR